MKTLLIDAPFLCHRAIHVMGQLSHDNQFTGVIFGFLSQIKTFSEMFDTNKMIFCWDSTSSIRKQMYPEYKNNRKSIELSPEDQTLKKNGYNQFDILRTKVLPFIGFKNNFIIEGYEADDIMAIISMYYDKDFLMITADNDMFQILDFTDMYSPIIKKTYTHASFVDKYKIQPIEWAKVKAIAGCTTDNVKGVPGVGEKTAIKYLKNQLKSKTKTYQSIKNSTKIIARNKKLVTLPLRGIEIGVDFYLTKKDKLDYVNFIEICCEYNFQSFLSGRGAADWGYFFKGE